MSASPSRNESDDSFSRASTEPSLSLEELLNQESRTGHLAVILQQLLEEGCNPIIVIDGSNLKRKCMDLDYRSFHKRWIENISEIAQALKNASQHAEKQDPGIVVIWDALIFDKDGDPAWESKERDPFDYGKIERKKDGSFNGIQTTQANYDDRVRFLERSANRTSTQRPVAPVPLLKRSVHQNAWRRLPKIVRGVWVKQFSPAGNRLQDADLLAAFYARTHNAALVWSNDQDFQFLGVNWMRALNLKRGFEGFMQAQILRHQDVMKVYKFSEEKQLRALAYRIGNDFFRGKGVKNKAGPSEVHLAELGLLCKCSSLSITSRSSRYDELIAEELSHLQVNNHSLWEAVSRTTDSQESTTNKVAWLRRFASDQQQSSAVVMGRHFGLHRLLYLLNEKCMLLGQHAFDPYMAFDVRQEYIEQCWLMTIQARFEFQGLPSSIDECSLQRNLSESMAAAEISGRAADLLVRRHFWWDNSIAESIGQEGESIWLRFQDIRMRLYIWVFHHRGDVDCVQEEAYSGIHRLAKQDWSRTTNAAEFLILLTESRIPTFGELWSTNRKDIHKSLEVLRVIILGSINEKMATRGCDDLCASFVNLAYLACASRKHCSEEVFEHVKTRIHGDFPFRSMSMQRGKRLPLNAIEKIRSSCVLETALFHIVELAAPLCRLGHLDWGDGYHLYLK